MTVSYTRSPRYRRVSCGDVRGQLGSAVVHRQDDALDRQIGVEVVANELECGQQLGQSFQGVVLALERDEHGIGGGQRIDGQQPERRRTIDQDVVVVGGHAAEQSLEAALPALDGRKLDFGAGELDCRRHHVQPLVRTGHDQLVDRHPIHDGVVDGALDHASDRGRGRWWRCPGDRGRRRERARPRGRGSSRGSRPSWSSRRRLSGSRRRSSGPLRAPFGVVSRCLILPSTASGSGLSVPKDWAGAINPCVAANLPALFHVKRARERPTCAGTRARVDPKRRPRAATRLEVDPTFRVGTGSKHSSTGVRHAFVSRETSRSTHDERTVAVRCPEPTVVGYCAGGRRRPTGPEGPCGRARP